MTWLGLLIGSLLLRPVLGADRAYFLKMGMTSFFISIRNLPSSSSVQCFCECFVSGKQNYSGVTPYLFFSFSPSIFGPHFGPFFRLILLFFWGGGFKPFPSFFKGPQLVAAILNPQFFSGPRFGDPFVLPICFPPVISNPLYINGCRCFDPRVQRGCFEGLLVDRDCL